MEQFTLRSINFLLLFLIKGNCLRIGGSQLLYLSTRRVIKQIVLLIEA